MDQVLEWFKSFGFGGGQVIENLAISITAFVAAKWIGNRLRKQTIEGLYRRSFARNEAVLLGRLVSLASYAVAIIISLIAWGVNSTGIFTTLGIFSVALGLSLQDVFRNFFAGVLLLLEKPFKVGDYMKVNNVEGEVLGIDTRTTMLRTPNGATVMIPNSILYSQITTTRSKRGSRRMDLQVTGMAMSAPALIDLIQRVVVESEMVQPPSGQPITISTSAEKTVVSLSVLLADGPEVREQFINAIMDQPVDLTLEVMVV